LRKAWITLPTGETIKPAQKAVRWLGIWFDPHLNFKEHVKIRSIKALNSFNRMDRLANLENGLTANSLRQIYRACIISTLDYGSPVWWKPSRSTKSLDTLQNKVARRILGVFRTAPGPPAALEAGLLPPNVRLERLSVVYGLRARDLPENHPVQTAIDKTSLTRPGTKEQTQLQGIKQRQQQYSALSKKEATKLLQEEVNRAWEKGFNLAKVKRKYRPDSYFQKYDWFPN
jgi:hypothetical protein